MLRNKRRYRNCALSHNIYTSDTLFTVKKKKVNNIMNQLNPSLNCPNNYPVYTWEYVYGIYSGREIYIVGVCKL